MRNILCVIVYNRFQNLERWLNCWSVCEHRDFEMIVIQNFDEGSDNSKFLEETFKHKITHILRANVGYDIGALQDIATGRIDLGVWDKLFWVSDDLIPMTKDFLKPYLNHFDERSVVCTEVSEEVKRHVRTSGFLISREALSKITFPADPVTTKTHCYLFEHQSENAFFEQIMNLGLKVAQALPLDVSALWDIDHRATMGRWREHEVVFGKPETVLVIATIFESFPYIIGTMLAQTHRDWFLLLMHDGPEHVGIRKYVEAIGDPRIAFVETKEREGNWGHGLRQQALRNISTMENVEYVVITNSDNYHPPVYLEYMLKGFTEDYIVATYCSSMTHSYVEWGIIECKLERGFLDCAGVMVRKDVACDIGWSDSKSHSADWTYFQEIAHRYGWENFKKVKGNLLVHN